MSMIQAIRSTLADALERDERVLVFGQDVGVNGGMFRATEGLQARFGAAKGRAAWRDFREKRDPETITTIRGTRFPYETASPFAKRGLALPDPGSVRATPTGAPVQGAAAAPGLRFVGFTPRPAMLGYFGDEGRTAAKGIARETLTGIPGIGDDLQPVRVEYALTGVPVNATDWRVVVDYGADVEEIYEGNNEVAF